MKQAGITIADLCRGDIDDLHELEQRTPHAPHWQRTDYEQILNADEALKRVAVVARDGNTFVGFAIAKVLTVATEKEAELETIVVRSEERGHGIGARLMSALSARLARDGVGELRLEVRASNQAAISLYNSCGFEPTGLRKRYYRDPVEDALLMQLRSPFNSEQSTG